MNDLNQYKQFLMNFYGFNISCFRSTWYLRLFVKNNKTHKIYTSVYRKVQSVINETRLVCHIKFFVLVNDIDGFELLEVSFDMRFPIFPLFY